MRHGMHPTSLEPRRAKSTNSISFFIEFFTLTRDMLGIFRPPKIPKYKFLKSCIDISTRFLEKKNFQNLILNFFKEKVVSMQ